MKRLARLTEPLLEPLAVEELEWWADTAISDVDGIADVATSEALEGVITDQRQFLETELGRATVNATWKLSLDDCDVRGEITIPMPPLVSVESITTYDTDDVPYIVPTIVYQVVPGDPGCVVLRYCQVWPSSLRENVAMEIAFTAGYGTDPINVPGHIRTGIKQLVTYLYKADRGTGMFEGSNGYKGTIPDMVATVLKRLVIYDARRKVG